MKNYISILIVATLVSCLNKNHVNSKNNTELISIIQKPFVGDFVNDTVFEINPLIKNVLETPNGSSITIPANCIVSKNGMVQKEKVLISFNQYHSVLDVISAGIPMNYDTLGVESTFETAGMFNIKANSNKGETLMLKKGSKMQVNLASDKDDEKFNFYKLDDKTGQWSFKPNKHTSVLNDKCESQKKIIKPKKSTTKNPFVLDLNFDLTNYPELETFNGIVWEYTGKNDSLDPRKNRVANTKWTKFELTPTNEQAYEYYLKMSNKRNSFVTKVKAMLNGEDLLVAISNYKTAQLEFEKNVENLQKPIIRSVNISGFGTYNYDYIYHIKSPAPIVADFKFNNKSDKEHALIMVVYEEDDVVVNYPHNKWSKFGLNTESKPKIIAILPNNKLAVYKGDVAKTFSKSKFTYKMDVLPNKINNKVDLLKAIQNI